MSNLPAPAPAAGLPALYDPVDPADIQIPAIYLLQPLSKAVQNGVGKPGDVILGLGADDPAPTFLVGGPDDEQYFDAYVVSRKKFAATTADGSIQFHRDNKRDPNDPDSWEGYYFYLAIPEVDEFVPARVMLWRTAGAPPARQINTMIARSMARGETDPIRVRFTVRQKTNKKGQPYYAFAVGPAVADKDGLDSARQMQAMIATLSADMATENDAPAVGEQPTF